jgi:hypothetical protein
MMKHAAMIVAFCGQDRLNLFRRRVPAMAIL